MSKEKYEKPFALDMPFGEALARYAQTDPREVPEPEKKKKRKRAPLSISESTEEAPTSSGKP
jgi:hypothetical protein